MLVWIELQQPLGQVVGGGAAGPGRRLMLPQAPKFQQRYTLYRVQMQGVLWATVAAP